VPTCGTGQSTRQELIDHERRRALGVDSQQRSRRGQADLRARVGQQCEQALPVLHLPQVAERAQAEQAPAASAPRGIAARQQRQAHAVGEQVQVLVRASAQAVLHAVPQQQQRHAVARGSPRQRGRRLVGGRVHQQRPPARDHRLLGGLAARAERTQQQHLQRQPERDHQRDRAERERRSQRELIGA
jgi:hypothetical protein